MHGLDYGFNANLQVVTLPSLTAAEADLEARVYRVQERLGLEITEAQAHCVHCHAQIGRGPTREAEAKHEADLHAARAHRTFLFTLWDQSEAVLEAVQCGLPRVALARPKRRVVTAAEATAQIEADLHEAAASLKQANLSRGDV